MDMLNGFAPYKAMMDSEGFVPGRTIVVGGTEYRTMPVRNRVLRRDLYVLRNARLASERDARKVLESKEWYVKK